MQVEPFKMYPLIQEVHVVAFVTQVLQGDEHVTHVVPLK